MDSCQESQTFWAHMYTKAHFKPNDDMPKIDRIYIKKPLYTLKSIKICTAHSKIIKRSILYQLSHLKMTQSIYENVCISLK